MFLIAEYCRGPFFMGWHLYLRENRVFRRNSDGGWGWIRGLRDPVGRARRVIEFLESIGITLKGDGTTDADGVAVFARRYPVKGRRCGGRRRGCVEIVIRECGKIEMAKTLGVNCHVEYKNFERRMPVSGEC